MALTNKGIPTYILKIACVGQYNKLVLCQLQRQLALRLRNKSVISHLWLKIAHTPWHILNQSLYGHRQRLFKVDKY